MIHQLSTGHVGKYLDLVQSMSNSELLMEKLIQFYSDRSKLEKEDIKDLMKIDKYLDATTCYEYGLIDIIDR